MVAGNQTELAGLVFLGLVCLVAYRAVRWVMEAKCTADPWGPEVDEALDRDEAAPLCHHCLTPQHHNGWFCPECGATVGPYSNYLPYVYLFSQGEVLRAGVTERLRHSPLIVLGYLLLSLGFFGVLWPLFLLWLPVYWVFLTDNLRRRDSVDAAQPPALG